MNELLRRALEKIGVKSYNDLNEEEKFTFKRWEETLKTGKMTEEDVIDQIKTFKDEIEEKLFKKSTEYTRDYLISQLEVVKYILRFVEEPKRQAEILKKELERVGENNY